MTQQYGSSPVLSLLTTDQLRALFAPLTTDYCAAVALAEDLAHVDRRGVIQARIAAYGEALGEALGVAVEQSTTQSGDLLAVGGAR